MLPPKELLIVDPDSYDIINKITVNEYNESHYVEHEGLQIEFLKELEDVEGSSSEREQEPINETKDAIP